MATSTCERVDRQLGRSDGRLPLARRAEVNFSSLDKLRVTLQMNSLDERFVSSACFNRNCQIALEAKDAFSHLLQEIKYQLVPIDANDQQSASLQSSQSAAEGTVQPFAILSHYSFRSVVQRRVREEGTGDILGEMSQGTQIKVVLDLTDGFQALMKPYRCANASAEPPPLLSVIVSEFPEIIKRFQIISTSATSNVITRKSPPFTSISETRRTSRGKSLRCPFVEFWASIAFHLSSEG